MTAGIAGIPSLLTPSADAAAATSVTANNLIVDMDTSNALVPDPATSTVACNAELTKAAVDAAKAANTDSPVPSLNNGEFMYAMWVEKAPASTMDKNYLADVAKSGQQLKVKKVGCLSDGTFQIYPDVDDSVPAEQQSRVILSADANTLQSHLFLVYLNLANVIDQKFTIANQTGDTVTVTLSDGSVRQYPGSGSIDSPSSAVYTDTVRLAKTSTGTFSTEMTLEATRNAYLEIPNKDALVTRGADLSTKPA